jgi:hypothetical protein
MIQVAIRSGTRSTKVMEIPAITDHLGLTIIYVLLCTVGTLRPMIADALLTHRGTGRLFIYWYRRVQSLVSPLGDIPWSKMECLLTPPCLVRNAARILSVLLELSS